MPSLGSIQKTGLHSWKLTVSGGFDGSGKRIRYTKTVHVTSDVPEQQEKEAQHQLALFIGDLKKGNNANSGKMTLTQFYNYWKDNYASKNHVATTLAYNENLFKRIKEVLGHKRLDKIEPKHLLQFYNNLAEPGIKKVQHKKSCTEPLAPQALSANTIKKHHTLLHTLFAKAVQWNLIPYNPADRVEPPKVEHTIKQIYNQEQLGQFLQFLDSEPLKHRVMVLLALTGGLRREEIFGLEWHHVDFENNSIRIEQASVYTPSTGTTIKETKNVSSNRIISIPSSIIDLLKQYKTSQLAKRLKLGGTIKQGGKWEGSENVDHDRLFTTWNGKPAHPHSFNKWLTRFTIKNNLPSISPHAFRHMAATYLIAAGTDIRTVSGKLGHAQTSTTINIYSHLLKSAEQQTAETMEAFLQQTTAQAKNKQAN